MNEVEGSMQKRVTWARVLGIPSSPFIPRINTPTGALDDSSVVSLNLSPRVSCFVQEVWSDIHLVYPGCQAAAHTLLTPRCFKWLTGPLRTSFQGTPVHATYNFDYVPP